ncbi:hypothetical protein AeMF1_017003 [Aphanomyces euteiches]|nr:hypothetical protein AeMF1_017003 [Aphanomyces euteiches]KAH9196448.1 hypothetical protein AeNC1_001592 [Aphanomyces euteiches]
MAHLVNLELNEALIPDSKEPQHLEAVRAADEARRQLQDRKERANLIPLVILHLQDTKKLRISKFASLSEATEKAAMLFDVPYDPTLVRLRSYSEHRKLPMDTYTGLDHCSLMKLQLHRQRTLLLEVRSSLQDEWMEYDSSALQLLVRKFERLPKPHCTEPVYVLQIEENATVKDLLDKLTLKFELDCDKCRLLHMSVYDYWDIQTNILNPTNEDTNLQRSLSQDLHLHNRSAIYVEECSSLDSRSDAKDFFETKANSLTIYVKCTDNNILGRTNDPAISSKESATWRYVVDRREPLQTLKDQLVKFLNMPPNTFRLLRGSSETAQELQSFDLSFKKLTFVNNTMLFLTPGRPLAGDEYRIKILWYQPKPRPKELSNFLQGGVQSDELTLLMKFIVLNNVMVDKVRAAIAQQFAVKGIHAPYLRLQDYYHRRLNNILIDGFQLNQASTLTPFENRQFVVQILAEPEVLPRVHMLYYVSVFDRANLKFGPRQEIIFECKDRQESWFDIFSHKVHEVTSIPVESMIFAKPHQSREVSALDVEEELSWIDREQGRHHVDPKSLGIYGDRIVVADGSVPLKKLSKDEQDVIRA